MIAMGAALCAMVACVGAVLVLAAWRGVLSDHVSTGVYDLWKRAVDNVRRTTRVTWLRLVAGLVVGVSGWMILAWPILLVVGPLASVGLPYLLADPPQRDLAVLEALDRWVRGLLAHLSTGRSIQDAIRLTAKDAPSLLAASVGDLVRRLDDRWTLTQALHQMADDFDSADADAVLAALVLSAQRGGTGANITLQALAESIQERLKALREIEAERAKPRVVVRQVTLMTAGALVLFLVISPGYFAPYSTAMGQVLLAVLIACYVASLWAMRRLTLPRVRARILRSNR